MAPTSSITIRRLDPAVKERLQQRAAAHGRSMEAEVREILNQASAESPPEPAQEHWVDRMRRTAAKYGYWDDLVLPPRDQTPVRAVDFSGPEFDPVDGS